MTALDTYLATLPGRCTGCGCHTVTQGCRCVLIAPSDEWAVFVAAITQAARDGVVSQTNVRPLIRSIPPKHRGQLYRRARAEGLLIEIGREDSTDIEGRNGDKTQRLYRIGRAV